MANYSPGEWFFVEKAGITEDQLRALILAARCAHADLTGVYKREDSEHEDATLRTIFELEAALKDIGEEI